MKQDNFRTLIAGIPLGFIFLVWILASSPGLAQSVEVIVGNRDTTSSSGAWYNSNGLNSYSGRSFYSNDDTASFTWYAVLPQPGKYDVYAWWTYRPNRATSVPYRVKHSVGESYTFVNQRDQSLAGRWNLLGNYTFEAGFLPEISVFANRGQANADAIRMVYTGGQEQEAWPVTNCPCDVLYDRGVAQYTAWGGSLVPQGFNGGAATIACEPTNEYAKVTYSAAPDVGTDDLTSMILYSVILEPGVKYECGVIVDSTLHPTGRVQTRQIGSSSGEWSDACMASVLDYCPE